MAELGPLLAGPGLSPGGGTNKNCTANLRTKKKFKKKLNTMFFFV